MRRRGMTLLELLLALALLGSLCSLLSSWLVTVSRLTGEQAPRMQWRSSAQRVLDAIGDDLECGDFQTPDRRREGSLRFEIVDGQRLRIEARSTYAQDPTHPGPAVHEYHIGQGVGMLVLSMFRKDGSSATTTRPLLSDVADWTVIRDDQDKTLTVTIEAACGEVVGRRYPWP